MDITTRVATVSARCADSLPRRACDNHTATKPAEAATRSHEGAAQSNLLQTFMLSLQRQYGQQASDSRPSHVAAAADSHEESVAKISIASAAGSQHLPKNGKQFVPIPVPPPSSSPVPSHAHPKSGMPNGSSARAVPEPIQLPKQPPSTDSPTEPTTPPSLPTVRPAAGSCLPKPNALLPPQRGPNRKTLVLDLDQTLIECFHVWFQGSCNPDFIYKDCEGCNAKVWKRPHLMEFLKSVNQDFEVVLFTAALQRHADAVLSVLDPSGMLVEHRLYGHHTVQHPQWSWVKDLSRLGRDLSQTLIVDDCQGAALLQPENWVSIKPYSQSEWRSDSALLDILAFLRDKVLPADDVREAIAQHYSQELRRPKDLPCHSPHVVHPPSPQHLRRLLSHGTAQSEQESPQKDGHSSRNGFWQMTVIKESTGSFTDGSGVSKTDGQEGSAAAASVKQEQQAGSLEHRQLGTAMQPVACVLGS